MDQDLRRSPRYLFFASAEITEFLYNSQVTTHTNELARHGCHLDMMNPFMRGTALRVRILHDGQLVDAQAHVIHARSNVGMGIAFDQIERAQEQTLEKWIVELQGAGAFL